MKKTRKMLAMMLSMMLVAVMAIGGTYAYLTSTTQVVTNTFTVGNVKITLDEAKVTEYGVVDGTTRVTANTYKLIPGHTYTKDPTVHVDADSEESWLFVKVENGISAIEAADSTEENGTKTIATQMAANGWTLVAGKSNVYAYKQTVSANDNIPVFGDFTLADDANVSAYSAANISITAYAVQADGLNSAADAWTAAPATGW